jgi:hypothetical protein
MSKSIFSERGSKVSGSGVSGSMIDGFKGGEKVDLKKWVTSGQVASV